MKEYWGENPDQAALSVDTDKTSYIHHHIILPNGNVCEPQLESAAVGARENTIIFC